MKDNAFLLFCAFAMLCLTAGFSIQTVYKHGAAKHCPGCLCGCVEGKPCVCGQTKEPPRACCDAPPAASPFKVIKRTPVPQDGGPPELPWPLPPSERIPLMPRAEK